MKICLRLVHLIALTTALAMAAVAQAGLPKAEIVTVTLDPQNVTVLHLRKGFVSSVRLPEDVSSVVLGDPGAFKAEHSEAEPQLVFFKPASPKPAETNALITTRTGHEVSLSLVSEGNSGRGGAVDYVLKYEHPRSFLLGAAQTSFLIADTKSLIEESPSVSNAEGEPRHRRMGLAQTTKT
jgi:hypothetical protein